MQLRRKTSECSTPQPVDQRKGPFSLGHARRALAGQAPWHGHSAPIETQLDTLSHAAENGTLPWHDVQQAVLRHRDAFKASPQHALLPRPGHGYKVNVPGHGERQATLHYDLKGRVAAQLGDALRGVSPYTLAPAGRCTQLSEADLQRMVGIRAQLEATYNYSTAAGAMAVCRRVRHARETGHGDGSFAAAARGLELPAQQLLDTYGGGTCFTMAEVMRDRIHKQFGIEAYVVSEQINNFVVHRPDRRRSGEVNSAFVLHHLQGDTHADVVVPYYDEQQQVCFAKFKMGSGPDQSGEAMEVFEPAIVVRNERMRQYGILPKERVIGRPSRLAAEAVGGPTKLNIMTWKNRQTFGIDVLRQIAYLNEAATPAGQNAVQIDLASEDGLHELGVFLGVVEREFKLDYEAIKDLRFLCEHLGEFSREVLAGPMETLQACIHERDIAVRMALPAQMLYDINRFASTSSRAVLAALYADAADAIETAAQHVDAHQVGPAKEAYIAATRKFAQLNNLLEAALGELTDHELDSALAHRPRGKKYGAPQLQLWQALDAEQKRRQT